jgi:hypothetical protein
VATILLPAASFAEQVDVTATDTPIVVADEDSNEPNEPGATALGPVVGIHIGPRLSVFSDLGAAIEPRLELGMTLPAAGGRLQPFAMFAWSNPKTDGTIDDARLPASGEFSYDVTQHEYMLVAGANVRFAPLGSKFNGYVGAGPQVVWLTTIATGESGGEAFGENREMAAEIGFYGALGGEMKLGPGALFAQVAMSWSQLGGDITGDANSGALTPSVGWRFMPGQP